MHTYSFKYMDMKYIAVKQIGLEICLKIVVPMLAEKYVFEVGFPDSSSFYQYSINLCLAKS